MNQDPNTRAEAEGVLQSLFSSIGRAQSDPLSSDMLGGLGAELTEFLQMPAELARIFIDMSFDLTEMVLESLAAAGIVLVKGLTPA